MVIILLQGGAEADAVDENGTCALKAACLADDAATVEVRGRDVPTLIINLTLKATSVGG